MMPPESNKPTPDTPPEDTCWSRVGVEGDRSCPTLAGAGHCRNCPSYSRAGQALFEREAPLEYVDHWTRQLAEADSATVGDAIPLLVFRIGPEWLAFSTDCVSEVISPRPIHRVPHRTDRLLLGVANIRGELQLCASLQELLGIEAPPMAEGVAAGSMSASNQRMIVAELERNRWVFPVDEVQGVIRLPAGAMESLPYTVQRAARYFCQALFSHGDMRVGTLSAVRVFQALETIVQ
jgi:chemotaxis-related protein WspD